VSLDPGSGIGLPQKHGFCYPIQIARTTTESQG
jgi:hypothetical protein